MTRPHLLVVGGGLAGLSTACYALVNGWDVTIFEHNLALGGVCTAWSRGPYTMDGCIHWLTGGPFSRIYEELEIVPPVEVDVLEQFLTYRHATEGWSVVLDRELARFERDLVAISPADAGTIRHVIEASAHVADLSPRIDAPPEITGLREQLRSLWEMRHEAGTLVAYRGTVAEWADRNLESPVLKNVFRRLMPADGPALFLLMILGYLSRGWLSRPRGGTAAFRDALVRRFEALGGEARLHTTVEEIVVEGDRAVGLRLTDGTISCEATTSSRPPARRRPCCGCSGGDTGRALRDRLGRWKLFDPIVLLGYGVERPLTDLPPTLLVDGITPFEIGGARNDSLYLRIYAGDPAFAPPGQAVVQLMASTTYDWWATRGADYGRAKDEVARLGQEILAPFVPGIAEATRVLDVATPLTFWRNARSWRGAYEGWLPTPETFFGHVKKTLPGLKGLHMAGQWVEPGGGVPTALMSGRQLVQILCHEAGRPFVPTP